MRVSLIGFCGGDSRSWLEWRCDAYRFVLFAWVRLHTCGESVIVTLCLGYLRVDIKFIQGFFSHVTSGFRKPRSLPVEIITILLCLVMSSGSEVSENCGSNLGIVGLAICGFWSFSHNPRPFIRPCVL